MGTNKTLFFTTFLGVFMILCACDPSSKYRKVVQNDSDYDVIVLLDGNVMHGYISDSILVPSHSEVIIFKTTEMGRTYEFKSCDQFLQDSIRIKIAGNDTLHVLLDPSNPFSWTYFTLKENRRKYGECECRLQIRNELIN